MPSSAGKKKKKKFIIPLPLFSAHSFILIISAPMFSSFLFSVIFLITISHILSLQFVLWTVKNARYNCDKLDGKNFFELLSHIVDLIGVLALEICYCIHWHIS